MRTRSWTLGALVPLLLAFAVAQDADEPFIDGRYQTTWTVSRTCELGPAVGSTSTETVQVKRTGAGQIRFEILDFVLTGTISGDLNFDAAAEGGNGDFIGHFTLATDGTARLSGVLGVRLCNVDDPAAARAEWNVRGTRPPPGGTPSPSERPGSGLGEGTIDVFTRWHTICRDRDLDDELDDECERSTRYADHWERAMREDRVALGEVPEATSVELQRLAAAVGTAARAGSLMVYGPCGLVPAFPLTRAMLPAFGRLFVQGMVGAGRGQPEQVRRAADLAEALLASTGVKDNSREDAGAPPCPS